ncbi:MAG: carbohydrate-binding domain-containing protein [Ruminococcaceae bacterium]|nr:carbohydrate-binding domain-containing protein [Oscillospiraceae bacterium]
MNRRFLFVLFACLFCLSACAPNSDGSVPTEMALTDPADTSDAEEGHLLLEGRRYTYTGKAEDISAKEDILTLQRGGTYRISGTLNDGCLRISAPHETLHLILDGVSLSSSRTTPLVIEAAACVILETAEGTVNRLTDTDAAPKEERLPAACLEASCQLVLRGSGSLILSGRRQAALSCTQTVTVESGSVTLSAPDMGLWVRDALILSGGALTVTAAERGIVAAKDETAQGLVTVSDGKLTVSATEVALVAGRKLLAIGGSADLSAPILYDAPSVVLDAPHFPKR